MDTQRSLFVRRGRGTPGRSRVDESPRVSPDDANGSKSPLRTSEVARCLRIRRKRVRDMVAAGVLKAVRDARGCWLFDADDVLREQRRRCWVMIYAS